MQRRLLGLSLVIVIGFVGGAVSRPMRKAPQPQTKPNSKDFLRQMLRHERSSLLDLEVAGDLSGLPLAAAGFVSREDLLRLPQVTYVVSDDSNFTGSTEVRGVSLDVLARAISSDGDKAMVVAVCDDLYRAHYPQAYIQAHHPLLVLEINGRPPADWPKSKDGSGASLRPYLISQPQFTPSFKILSHQDEPQIPWGVLRLEFRNEQTLLSDVAPRGATAENPTVQAGYRIAQQNCWRCHGPETEGPQKGKLTWGGIALFAATSPVNFANYVRNPQKLSKLAEMPGNPNYDDATMRALIAYFRVFFPQEKR
jgi:mono/diheme cytochrome c family protein